MSVCIDGSKLLKSYRTISDEIEHKKNNERIVLLVYGDKFIRNKIRKFSDKAFTDIRDLNVSEGGAERESLTVKSIDFLPADENKFYPQV